MPDRIRLKLLAVFITDAHRPRGDADHRRVRLHILHHHRVAANAGMIMHRNRAEHLRARAEDDIRANSGMALAFVPGCAAERYPLIHTDIVAELRCLADDDTHAVVNKKTAPDAHRRMNLHPRRPARPQRQPARQPVQADTPQRVLHAVMHHGAEARMQGQHRPAATHRRITRKHHGKILTNQLEPVHIASIYRNQKSGRPLEKNRGDYSGVSRGRGGEGAMRRHSGY